jgi:chromosome segregation ATPase
MSEEETITETIKEHDEEAVQKLKLLVQSLKKKYGEAVSQSYTLDQKNRELSVENGTYKQTVNALTQKFNQTLVELHDLEEKYRHLLKEKEKSNLSETDLIEEVKMLTDQHQILLKELSHHEEESKKALEELQAVKLKETQLERVIQFLRKRSEEAHLEMSSLGQEITQTQELNQNLTVEIKLCQETIKSLREELEVNKKSVQDLCQNAETDKQNSILLKEDFEALTIAFEEQKNSKEEISEKLKLTEEEYFTLKKEHQFLKQAMLREVEEIKSNQNLKKIEIEASLEQAKLEYLTQIQELQQQLKEKDESLEKYEVKEIEVQAAFETRALVLAEQEKIRSELDALKMQKDELEADKRELEQKLKTAQQHLAKKVRETTLMNEKGEFEKEKMSQLNLELSQAQIKIAELKNSLGMELEHHKKLLEKETELRKNAEAQATRLEERYFQVHEKWREAESEIRDYKKMEEKFNEFKNFFSSFNSAPPAPPVKPIETSPPPSFDDIPELKSKPDSEPVDLFETPSNKFKGSLF